jgi:Arc/MetJ-type ribon-helix-helix transcriptional regulator
VTHMRAVTVQLPEEMVAHIDGHTGRGGRSQYIRGAVEEQIARDTFEIARLRRADLDYEGRLAGCPRSFTRSPELLPIRLSR